MNAPATAALTADNGAFVDFWNDVLTPKWVRFRALLSGNGKVHSDIAAEAIGFAPGQRVLDIGCGFGETCLEIGAVVGAEGGVLGVDCTGAFIRIAEEERREEGCVDRIGTMNHGRSPSTHDLNREEIESDRDAPEEPPQEDVGEVAGRWPQPAPGEGE